MLNQATEQPQGLHIGLQWQWIIIGVVVGILLTGLAVFYVGSVFHSFIPVLIAGLSFILTGIIVGYNSTGVTIKEAALAGLLLALLTIWVISVGYEQGLSLGQAILVLVAGFLLCLIGGWTGEKLQGEVAGEAPFPRGFQWQWVLVGIVVGLILNIFFVAFFSPLFKLDLMKRMEFLITILAFWGLSFIVTGIIVGYKSPGITIFEAAIAGVVMILFNLLIIYVGLETPLPIAVVIIAMVLGFVLALFGAWIGEKMQKRAQRQT